MKKVIRLNERQLTSLIKKIIKEDAKPVGGINFAELKAQMNQIDYELKNMNLDPISDKVNNTNMTDEESINNIIDKELAKKGIKGAESEKAKDIVISGYKELLNQVKKFDVCTREGRKEAFRFLKNKIPQYISMIKKNKVKKIEEQIVMSGLEIAFAVVMGLGFLWAIIKLMKTIFEGDGCRQWSRWKQTQMVGY